MQVDRVSRGTDIPLLLASPRHDAKIHLLHDQRRVVSSYRGGKGGRGGGGGGARTLAVRLQSYILLHYMRVNSDRERDMLARTMSRVLHAMPMEVKTTMPEKPRVP